MSVQGLAELEAKWTRIPVLVRERVKDAMERCANDIIKDMKRAAPVLNEPDRRRKAGALRKSINWTWGDPPPGTFQIASASSGKEYGAMRLTIYAGGQGPGYDAFYARFVEFGTRSGSGSGVTSTGRKVRRTHPGTSAQPFFYPIWRIWRRRALARMNSAIKRAIRGK